MPASDSERALIGDDELLGLLRSTGFTFNGTHREDGDEVATWECSPPETRRHVYFKVHGTADRTYSIYVEEWRGGEGYEDEEFRSARASEALAAIERWVAWAREPFVESQTWWARFKRSWGIYS